MGISLDQINQEVDNRYAPFVVEDVPGGDVTMLSPLRLPKAQRGKLFALHKEIGTARDSEDVDALVKLSENVIDLVSVGDGGKRLLKELGGDLGKMTYILQLYSEQVGLGEASRSDG